MQVLPPVMLPVPRADGTYSHLRGQNGLLLFFNDKGWLVAHKGDGRLLWEVRRGQGGGQGGGTRG